MMRSLPSCEKEDVVIWFKTVVFEANGLYSVYAP